MGKIYLLAFLFLTISIKTQVLPNWEWARNIVQSNGNIQLKISSDPFGNVFVLGSTDANANPAIIPDSGAFLARYNNVGQLSWSIKLTGLPDAICASPLGDVYVAGTKQHYSIPTSSTSPTAAFIAKYSAAGNILWEKNYEGRYSNIAAMTVTELEHVYVTGYFYDSLQMDNTLLASANAPFFAARLNSAGTVQWLRGSDVIQLDSSAGGLGGGHFIASDSNENIYIEFNTSNCPNWSCDDHHILKLNSNGTFQFYKQYEYYSGSCLGLIVQGNGDIIMAHYTSVWTSGGGVVLKRYNSQLDSTRWSLNIGGWQCQQLMMDAGLKCDPSGNLYVAGTVGAQCWWPVTDTLQYGTSTLVTDSLSDLIVARVNKNSGQYIDAVHIRGRLHEKVTSISMDALGNCFVAGFFNNYYTKDVSHKNDTLCFGNDCLIGSEDNAQIFLAKLKTSNSTYSNGVSVQEELLPEFYISPNPSKSIFILNGKHSGWSIYSMSGELIQTGMNAELNLESQAPGIYILRVKTDAGIVPSKLLKIAD